MRIKTEVEVDVSTELLKAVGHLPEFVKSHIASRFANAAASEYVATLQDDILEQQRDIIKETTSALKNHL